MSFLSISLSGTDNRQMNISRIHIVPIPFLPEWKIRTYHNQYLGSRSYCQVLLVYSAKKNYVMEK